MNWKFWKKQAGGQVPGNGRGDRPSRPKDMPQEVGRFLVVDLHEDPDWVWDLKIVERRSPQDNDWRDIRVFDPFRVGGIKISDFQSLDAHPELVLFEGGYDRKTRQVVMEKKHVSGEMEHAA